MQTRVNEASTGREPLTGYELIDFGRGRKLESFGGILVDRPCPAAIGFATQTSLWESAELIYETPPDSGCGWRTLQGCPPSRSSWMVELRSWPRAYSLRLIVRVQSTGQLGLFPEHWQQWTWLDDRISRWRGANEENMSPVRAPRVLHLFAYTGATTLALAAMQAEVTHVDAMQSAVDWARENARASNLSESPIRWIVDDARKYVAREGRRGKKYDLILLDPPSYGHGPSGRAWAIQRDLEPLLLACAELVEPDGIGLVLTGHSPDVDLQSLRDALAGSAGQRWEYLETETAELRDRAGRELNCGYVARFFPDSPIGPGSSG